VLAGREGHLVASGVGMGAGQPPGEEPDNGDEGEEAQQSVGATAPPPGERSVDVVLSNQRAGVIYLANGRREAWLKPFTKVLVKTAPTGEEWGEWSARREPGAALNNQHHTIGFP